MHNLFRGRLAALAIASCVGLTTFATSSSAFGPIWEEPIRPIEFKTCPGGLFTLNGVTKRYPSILCLSGQDCKIRVDINATNGTFTVTPYCG